VIRRFPGTWTYVGRREDLTPACVNKLAPRCLFFLHWSWIVPVAIVDHHECVCFHMTDVPYGRGGSPLQNLILRGHRETQLTALRMTRQLDAGPVYLKETLSLSGSAEAILTRATHLSADMMLRIVTERPAAVDQSGEPVVFERRRPEQSRLPHVEDLDRLYDFIRMLDADGYPHAFLEHDGCRFEFRRAERCDGRVEAAVTITTGSGSDA
jgi:methionyl-tRNA formyltransferase